MSRISYRIKALAQKLPKESGVINPGIYESLDSAVIEYQKKLKNLVVLEEQVKPQTNFVLELKLEDKQVEEELQEVQEQQLQETPKRQYKRKTRRNINDDSN